MRTLKELYKLLDNTTCPKIRSIILDMIIDKKKLELV